MCQADIMIAALYVATDGCYFGVPGVDPWDIDRDARLYDGPWPVIAHPPCARWSALAWINQAQHGYKVGDDGGCFAAALSAVRRFGGVLEHPAGSIAWARFGLPRPARGCWSSTLFGNGWVTEVSQVAYGHRARKATWLYYVGDIDPPPFDWSDPIAETIVGGLRLDANNRNRGGGRRMYQREALSTPPAFRDALLALVAGAGVAA